MTHDWMIWKAGDVIDIDDPLLSRELTHGAREWGVIMTITKAENGWFTVYGGNKISFELLFDWVEKGLAHVRKPEPHLNQT